MLFVGDVDYRKGHEIILDLSVLCLAASALLSIGTPIVLLIILRKRFGAAIAPALIGAAAFVVFGLALKRLLNLLVVRTYANNSVWMSGNQYVFNNLVATCVFQETARFLSFKLLRNRYEGILTALCYGVGHGGIMLLLGGISTISSIVTRIAASNAQSKVYDLMTFIELQTTTSVPPAMHLLSGVERVFTLLACIALSVIVFYSVYENRRLWLYPAAILLHAIIYVPTVLAQVGVLSGGFWTEALALVLFAALVPIAIYTHLNLNPETSAAANYGLPDKTG